LGVAATTTLALACALAGCGQSAAPPAAPIPTRAALDADGCTPASQPRPKSAALGKPTMRLDATATYVATVETNCGVFEITLDVARAPKTTASFKALADQRLYDGTTFHRIVPGFVIQGGDPQLNGSGGPGYTVIERPPKDVSYVEGVVAMAKSGDEPAGASGSQFFVVTGDAAAELPAEYALVGKITGGGPIVQKIGAIITDPRTDSPEAPVVIKSIRVSRSE
jgi:cyclophilin family peptidyl-prolyl cis-trans isomerase